MAETATPLQTSEQLVRALKAAQDPPAPGQLPKIELARVAWADSSFFVPKKAELLADWSLESISRSAKLSLGTEGKEKGKGKGKGKQGFQGDVPYERDARYWSLLAEVLPAVAASGPGALPALSSKYPLLPPLSALLRGVSQTEALASSSEPKTLSAAAPVLTQLLPLAAARAAAANIDAVNECLKDLLAAVPSFQGADELSACKAILESLIGSWTAALEYGANAKKVRTCRPAPYITGRA